MNSGNRWIVISLCVVLAAMNTTFYLAIARLPLGITDATPAFTDPTLLAAAIGVGISSSVIPYVCDQLAMARLHRSTFALLLALLPATATLVGVLVLRQFPTEWELLGVSLVMAGVAVHRAERTQPLQPPDETVEQEKP